MLFSDRLRAFTCSQSTPRYSGLKYVTNIASSDLSTYIVRMWSESQVDWEYVSGPGALSHDQKVALATMCESKSLPEIASGQTHCWVGTVVYGVMLIPRSR